MNSSEYVILPLLVFLLNGALALYMIRRLNRLETSRDG